MERSVKELTGYVVAGTDGEIGKVDDLLFDDAKWVIRYLVVDTGGWLSGRRVLISPLSFGGVDYASKTFSLQLTRDQVERSPDVSTDQPVSRQYEAELLEHYGYMPYWSGAGLWGIGMYPSPIAPAALMGAAELPPVPPQAPELEAPRERAHPGDPHLRSAREVMGYHLHAMDGELGHVEDFVLDDRNYSIAAMVIDTRNWWPGKRVLVPPSRVTEVSWVDRKVRVELSRERIRSEPEFHLDRLAAPEL